MLNEISRSPFGRKLTWKNHIDFIENKITKNIGVLYIKQDCIFIQNAWKVSIIL